MKSKTEVQIKARQMRKAGKSLNEISRVLNVAKSSASSWCRDIKLTDEQIKLLKNRPITAYLGAIANKVKRQKQIANILTESAKEMDSLNPADLKRLKDLGTVMYWAEGRKKMQVDFTNSDPEMVKVAMLWFRKVCHVKDEDFRPNIYYHFNQNEDDLKEYWSEVTNVPLNQFRKSIFKKEGTGHRKKILYCGTCKIRICRSSDLLHKIHAWIKQLHLPST